MPTRNPRGDGEGLREGRMVLYRGVPARVVRAHWDEVDGRHRVVAAELYVPERKADVTAAADEIVADAPVPANSDGVRTWLQITAPELLALIGRITSSRHFTKVMLDISAVYAAFDSQREAAEALAAGLMGAWHDSNERVQVRAVDGEAWVQVWRRNWYDTTPNRQIAKVVR